MRKNKADASNNTHLHPPPTSTTLNMAEAAARATLEGTDAQENLTQIGQNNMLHHKHPSSYNWRKRLNDR